MVLTHCGFFLLLSIFGRLQVCSGNDNSFVVINQKGIDPPSLDLLAREGVSEDFEFRTFLSQLVDKLCYLSIVSLHGLT